MTCEYSCWFGGISLFCWNLNHTISIKLEESSTGNNFVPLPYMKFAIDLYSGIGGWTLGMKLSGIESLASYEWWSETNQTHNLNFGTNHREVNIREIDVERDLSFEKPIDFIVGSPPCT